MVYIDESKDVTYQYKNFYVFIFIWKIVIEVLVLLIIIIKDILI